MNIGIYTYGTRGDLQPYIALALGLTEKGHQVTISATEDFAALVEGFGVSFQPLAGNAEAVMNSEEGQRVLKTENPIQLMKYYFKILHDNRVVVRDSYHAAISKVDYIIANAMTLQIVGAIAEAQQKPMAVTYFMPPIVPTAEYPLGGFDLLDLPVYNKFTYKLARAVFWRFVKRDTNEYRKVLGLAPLGENLLTRLDRQRVLDLYCISPSLIPQPRDWESHHKITGFFNIPASKREGNDLDEAPAGLNEWLAAGSKPVYLGFGSNGVGNSGKFMEILKEILDRTGERVLFCTGWSVFKHIPQHKNLFVTKYVNHETIFPQCKVGIFHGGAGTLATMLRNHLPVIIVSFYTDQPTWGKIVERRSLGVHIPAKKLTAEKLIAAIGQCRSEEIKRNVAAVGDAIVAEKGLEKTIGEIENYFNRVQG